MVFSIRSDELLHFGIEVEDEIEDGACAQGAWVVARAPGDFQQVLLEGVLEDVERSDLL